MKRTRSIDITRMLAVTSVVAALLLIALHRLDIDTDIVSSLPTDDPVIADGIHLFEKNPVKDQIAIDIGHDRGDRKGLVAAAALVQERILASELFAKVGGGPVEKGLADLSDHVVKSLPVLFSAQELQGKVAPLLTETAIRGALTNARDRLYQMDGIGQASVMAADPLGLGRLLLSRLAALNPAPGATIYRGHILSADGRHLLVLATPAGSGTDTKVAREMTRFFRELESAVAQTFGDDLHLTPTGAFRAALDNETIVRSDVNRAIVWATVGIGLLLLLAFSRPLMGLLALLPALAGTVMALFLFSLVHDAISIMVLGFGGAIISITVDHGIAYMLFADGGGKWDGRAASREIRAVGLLAVLTSVGAFTVLAFSGFAVFEQLGMFTAMGIGCAFAFVHLVQPRLLIASADATTPPRRRFSRFVDRLASTGRPGLILAALLAVVLAFFARPHFDTDLAAMNTVSQATRAAERLMAEVWGDIFSNVYVMTEADGPAELRARNDGLQTVLDAEIAAGRIEPVVTPALYYPAADRREKNLAAWHNFWNEERIKRVTATIQREGRALGFAETAFAPFFGHLARPAVGYAAMGPAVRALFGITGEVADGRWRQVTRIVPRKGFDGQDFFDRVGASCVVFDPGLFSRHMGNLLFDTFMKMLLIIAGSLIALISLFFVDAALVLISLLPLAFAFVCTLGTLGIMGRSLDIPALMLSVVILGMGVDYTLFLVRGYQRYRRFDHPGFKVVRTAVVMAAGSTLIGFAVLVAADHDLLKSAGWISLCGIGYCLAGSLLILPPLLRYRFDSTGSRTGGVDGRYENMEPYPRLFARYKRRWDPLFDELAGLLPAGKRFSHILDVGCGYGVPACWLAERYPDALIHGIEPEPERVRVAALALGDQGRIVVGAAPDLPPLDAPLDLATLLDMSHYLTDRALEKTVMDIRSRLSPHGMLIARSVLPPDARPHWTWNLEQAKLRINGIHVCYRSPDRLAVILRSCGFEVVESRFSGKREDMWWQVARPSKSSLSTGGTTG